MPGRLGLMIVAAVMATSLAFTAPAPAAVIDADASGNWYNPEQAGHGLQLEVLDLSRGLLAWYTFDQDGNPLWLFGIGEIEGDTLHAELSRYHGTRFPPDFESTSVQGKAWGEVTFQLGSCESATLSYEPADEAYQSGTIALSRLTRIDAAHCAQGKHWEQQRRWQPSESTPGFEGAFFDYPDGEETFYQLASGVAVLPEPWQELSGMRISGDNRSDDLMMVLMRPVDGLAPDTRYDLELEMQFATNVPEDCAGVGGSPGESVYMRLGAAGEKPGHTLVDGYRRPALDLGQQSQPGERALSAGDMANGADGAYCTSEDPPWRLKRVSTADQEFSVTSDETGRIWVYGLSDSGFEATSTWYLTEFVVRLSEAGQ